MYFLLTTGRIVTERDLRIAYEICIGTTPGVHPGHYEEWTHKTYGIIRSIPKDEISIEQLIKGKCIAEAVRVYSTRNNCSLRDAKNAVFEIFKGV